jgi:signal transduction histidine kinase
VQEALTNTRRHATPGNTAAITIDYRGRELLVRVEDDGGPAGTAAAPAVEGNGITGMRERATALGGTFSAGPRPAGGWQVHAILPLPADETDHRVDGEPVDVPDGSPAVGESAGQEETT